MRYFREKAVRLIVVSVACLLFFTSCDKKIGYFVVTWPPEESKLELTEIYAVKGESNLRHVYILELEKKVSYCEIEQFRGQMFKTISEAQKFKESYLPYKDLFAYVNKKFPMRTAPDVYSSRAYMLREGDIIKILGRQEEKVTLGPGLEGYWYNAVTSDGVNGYCFDKNLKVFNNLENSASDYVTVNDFNFEQFLNTRWYPVEYKENIKSNYPDINLLRSGEMVFADSEKKTVRLRTKEQELVFNYTSVQQIAEDKVFFNGTPLELRFYPDGHIFLRYSYQGEDFSGSYVTLEKDISEYIAGINETKDSELKKMLGNDKSYYSDIYGNLTFGNGRRFTWTDFDNINYIIPESSGQAGVISNDYYVSRSLKKEMGYEGILTFTFFNNAKDINFICKKEKNGDLILINIPKELLFTGVVTKIPDNATGVIFHPVKENQ